MPSRLIRDGILDSEAVLSLPVEARWLYVTILLTADDLGLFEATQFRLARKADVDRDRAGELLDLLVRVDLVRLYEVGGKRYGFIPKYRQRLQIKRSKYPMPPSSLVLDDDDAVKKINDLTSKTTVDHGCATLAHGDSPPEPEPEPEKYKPPKAPRKRGVESELFAAFWKSWPKSERKQDRAKCLDHWNRHSLDAVADRVAADIVIKKQTQKWRDGYIEMPLTYLHNKRWEDGVEPGAPELQPKEWYESQAGYEQKAREIGHPPHKETEALPLWRASVERMVKDLKPPREIGLEDLMHMNERRAANA